jgi:hypothetical protein
MYDSWWLWAWAALLGFQFLMLVLAPVLILPLFNKFAPLPEGSLKARLLNLAERTRFRARSIQVMDGSKRSRHSNAFFTGFGRFRKIVLFDTLMQQLAEPELEAVLAHEIGHYKKKHIPKSLAIAAVMSLAGFWIISLLARQEWFYRSFGFQPGSLVPALLLFGTSRIRGGRVRRRGDERIPVVDSGAAQVEREKPEQPHAASLVQWILLFAPGVVGAGKGAQPPELKYSVFSKRRLGWRCSG